MKWQNSYDKTATIASWNLLKPLNWYAITQKISAPILSSTSYPLKNIAKERDITFEMQLMQTQWIMDKVSFVQLLKTLTAAGSIMKLKNV